MLYVPANATMAAAETDRVGKSEICLPEQILRRQQQTTIKQNMEEKQRPGGCSDGELMVSKPCRCYLRLMNLQACGATAEAAEQERVITGIAPYSHLLARWQSVL